VKRSLAWLFGIAGAVLALDMGTKRWASETLAGSPPVPVIGELVRFTYTRNSGVASGIGAGIPFPYYLFSIAAVIAILYLFLSRRVTGSARLRSLALILGGAVGNLVDRLRTGDVVDFIEIGWNRWHWPVFNVADSAVSIGVVLFALSWPRHDSSPVASESGPIAADAAAGPPASAPPPPGPSSAQEHHARAGSLGSGAGPGGAARPLPGRGADGPLA